MSDQPTTVLDNPVVLDPNGLSNEQGQIVVTAEGGTWTFTYAGKSTGNLAYNISASDLEAAIDGLSTVANGDIEVSGGPGDATGSKPYILTFGDGLGDEDVASPTVNGSGLTATGTKTAVYTTLRQGAGNVNAVIRGAGRADRTEDVSPLTGQSPAANRSANKATYGDA